jgi:putative ABC transport system substrate-binding protein
LSHVGVLLAPANVGSQTNIAEARAAAQALKLRVVFGEVHKPADIDVAIATFAKEKVGAVYVTGATMLAAHSGQIATAVTKHRLPAAYAVERYVEAGGLLVYSPSLAKAFVRIAGYVDRILRGARPAEMPFEQVSDVELVINLRTAKTLGLRIPQTILQRADRAIE